MILDCPSCRTRYLVQISHFAAGKRQVRCAKCKHEWHASLPTTIDVFVPAQPPPDYHPHPSVTAVADGKSENQPDHRLSYQLPAVIKNWNWRSAVKPALLIGAVLALFVLLPIVARQAIVNKFPNLKGIYQSMGFAIDRSGKGLVFDQVKSELKYDGGTMRLIVDGVVHNTTDDLLLVPNIKARALGPDQHIIQSWWVPAPVTSLAGGSDAAFHTEVNAPMKQTIETVYLEFYDQDEQGNVDP